MKISEKIEELLKYCSVYQGHVNMMDERRTDDDFHVTLQEETDILASLDKLQFILLTGEAGDGKSRLIRALWNKLQECGFCEPYMDFSAETEEEKEKILQRIADIIDGKTDERVIIAANVGIFTKSVLKYQRSLMEKLNRESERVKIINFEKRNLAQDEKIFQKIVQAFLKYDGNLCGNSECQFYGKCAFQENLDYLLSEKGIESVRVMCDAVCLIGEHVTFRELLSLLSYMVTFGESCRERGIKGNQDNGFIESVFRQEQHADQVLLHMSDMDPAFKNSRINTAVYASVEECRREKRKNFFYGQENQYGLLAADYLTEFREVIRFFQNECYIDSAEIQNGELYRLKRGLGRLTRRGQSDLAMKVVDTPVMLGNDIQTEFELGNIDMIWHRYGLDFNSLDKISNMPEGQNRFSISYVYQEEDGILGAITLTVDYRLFRFLMMADDYYYLSYNSKTLEDYQINSFYHKILKKKKGAYERMHVRFTSEQLKHLCDFSLSVQHLNHFLKGQSTVVKIRKEG